MSICREQHKVGHHNVAGAETAARASAREWNRQGVIVVDMYAYRCPACRHWHITRKPSWDEVPNVLVLKAASEELQRFAMTGEIPTQRPA